MANIRCSVCGAPNPDTLERCRACNQLLEQSTKELNGFGERIASGQTPTEKSTSELEQALPAWLRHARQGDQQDEAEASDEPKEEALAPDAPAEDEPILPDFSVDEEDEDEELDAGDWLAGLANSADDDDDDEADDDWLKGLQGDLPAESEDEPAPEATPTEALSELIEETEDEEDDWLSSLQDSASEMADDLPDLMPVSEDSQQDDIALPEEDGVPDWLSRMSEEAESSVADVPEPVSAPQSDAQPVTDEADDGLPNWLDDLQSVGEISTEAPAEEPVALPSVEEAPVAASGDDLPDWLGSLQASEEVPVEEEAPAPPAPAETEDDDLPDWLGNLQAAENENMPASEEKVEAAAPIDDLPDWMTDDSTAAETPTPVVDDVPAEIEASDDLPDWMASLEGTEDADVPATPAADDDLPDWMSSSETGGEAPPELEKTEAEEPAFGEIPDWMSADEPIAEQAAIADATEAEPAGDLPDWIQGSVEDEVAPVASADAEVTEDAVSADLPDWMSGLAVDDDADEESPEWLTGGEVESEVDEQPQSMPAFGEDVVTESSDDLPDWMQGLGESEAQTDDVSQQALASTTEASGQESVSPLADEEAEVPDWLSRMGKPTTGSLASNKVAEEAISPELEAADEAPAWLDSLPGIDDLAADEEKEEAPEAAPVNPAFVADATSDGASDEEIFGIDMPDWLSSLAPEDLGTGDEAVEGTAQAAGEADLSDGELPSWVQAMRPVASVVDSSDDDGEQVVTEDGPLAGLSGILPVGIGLGPKSKPKAYALKLRVNESQQHGARLLEQILQSEGKAAVQASQDLPVSIPLLRWLIAGLMIVVLVGALLLPQELVPSPNIIVPEVGATLNTINELPENGTVLVVFDYEAALSAELQVAAAPVVDHLMLRGQRIAILSSTPNGTALAERFMNETQSQHNYEHGVDYLNLGYLPGGASGILSFIVAPQTTVVGQVDGQSFWALPPLANISQFTDFAAVIVLTDDTEKGRAWVEQGSAILNNASTPFLMAVSAQTEPVIYPYYASGQVDGLVSGLNGGATYERLQGQSGVGRQYWDAYSVGLLTAEILIVVGAILNFMAGLRARKNLETEEE